MISASVYSMPLLLVFIAVPGVPGGLWNSTHTASYSVLGNHNPC